MAGEDPLVHAAQSLEQAEKKVQAQEGWDEAVTIATEAMTTFTAAGKLDGVAEAFAIVIEAELVQALHRRLAQVGGHRLFQRSVQMLQSRVRKELRRFEDEEHLGGQGKLQLLLAQLYVAQRHETKSDLAVEAVDIAVDLLSQVDDSKYLSRAYLVRAELALNVGDRMKAVDAVNAALTKTVLQDRGTKAKALHLQGMCHKMTDTLEGLRSAADSMGKAVDIYHELALPLRVADELAAQADVYYIMENDNAALDAASQALSSVPLSTPSPSYDSVVTTLVQLHLDNGEVDAAADVAIQHIQGAQQSSDMHRELTASALLVLAHLRSGRHLHALQKAQTGLELAQLLEDPECEAKARLTLAQVCAETEKGEDAREYAEGAVSILQRLNAPLTDVAAVQKQAAGVLLASGHPAAAFGHASDARENYGEGGDTLGKCEALLLMSECEAAQGTLDLAIATCTEVLGLLKAAGSTRLQASALAQLSLLYEAAGDLEGALRMTREQRSLVSFAGFRKLEAQALERLGNLFFTLEKYDMCVQVAREGHVLARAKKNVPLQVSLLMLIVDAALQKPLPTKLRSDSAYRQWKDHIQQDAQMAINLCQEKPCQRRADSSTFVLRAEATFVYAKALLLFQGPQVAEDMAKEALQYFKQGKHKRGIGLCNLLLADSYRAVGVMNLALIHARDARHALQEIGEDALVDRATEILAACGDVPQAAAPQGITNTADAELPAKVAPQPPPPPALQSKDTSKPGKAIASSVDVLSKHLLQVLMDVIADDTDITVDTPFIDAGIDSLGMVAFRADLKEKLDVDITPEYLFDNPNVHDLSKVLFDELHA